MYNYDIIPSPCFVLIEADLIKNLEKIHYVKEKAGVTIICALKGFAMWSVFPLIKQYLDGATASSLNEALLIKEEMQTEAHTYCPVYIPADFEQIVKLSSHLTFNSISEYKRYTDVAKKIKPEISLGLRINPEYSEIKVDIYNPAIPDSRLGVTVEKLGDNLPEYIDGLHFHLLCEQDSYTLERVLKKTVEKFHKLFNQCKWINMGGGHLITHKNYDVEHLIKILKEFKEAYPHCEIILEPGAAIAWETGFLKATILDIIENGRIINAMLDVSFAAHMPDTLEMPYKPRITGAKEPQENTPVYRFGGTTCLAGDFMGDYSFDEPLKVGQSLYFEDMMHYTMVKTNFFNGVNHPGIGILKTNGKFELIRKFEYQDFKNRLS